MKKIFTTIFSLAALAACSTSETEEIQPEFPQQDTTITEYVEIGVSADTDNDTKATYDKDLHAYWEAGDQIKIIQGSATSDTYHFPSTGSKTFGPVEPQTLALSQGQNTTTASFKGTITYYDTSNSRYFHIAYPATNTTLATTTTIPYGKSQVASEYKTNTTCTYTIPSEQDGIWTPFLCGSTDSAISYSQLSSQNVSLGTSRNACLAIRVFEYDRTTAQQAETITITANQNIIGTFTATTDNNGSFSGKEFAYNGTGNTITANVASVEKLGDYYEYRFEVAPCENCNLEIVITADGDQITRTATGLKFTKNTLTGINVAWDNVGITMAADSWWEDTAKGNESEFNAGLLYTKVTIKGVGVGDIKEEGIYVNGTKYPFDGNKALSFDKNINITTSNGAYEECSAYPYVITTDDEEFTGAPQTIIVTKDKWKPAVNTCYIKSSYNNNGVVEKTNNLDGKTIYAYATLKAVEKDSEATLSGSYLNLVNSAVTLNYGAGSVAGAINTELTAAGLTVGEYNCTINIDVTPVVNNTRHYQFAQSATTNVTGIPYYWITSTTKVECNKSTTISDSCNTYAPTTIDAKIYYNITMCGKTISHTGTLTVNGTQIFSQASTYNKDINYNNATSPNTMKLSNQTSIDFTYTNKTNSSLGTTSTGYSNINEICIKY